MMSLRPIIKVAMGQSVAILKGNAVTLFSGPLTYCSCMVVKATRNGEDVANMMCHRGIETKEYFKRNLIEEIKSKNLGNKDIVWSLVSFQTAPTTIVPETGGDLVEGGIGNHECTAEAIISDVNDVLRIEESIMRNRRSYGQREDSETNICKADVEPGGKAKVTERSGTSTRCIVM